MHFLRDDWKKLDKARELLEDGPIDYLDGECAYKLEKLLDNIELEIKSFLSIKELAAVYKR